jgi:hypothetical protein
MSGLPTAEERRRTAFHEAGHACLALKHSGPGSITIKLGRPGGPHGGECWHDSVPRRASDLEELRAELEILVAGRLAEAMADGREPLRNWDVMRDVLGLELPGHAQGVRGGQTALEWAHGAFERIYPERGRHAFEAIGPSVIAATVKTLRANWATVERLAAQLIEAPHGATIVVRP